MKQQLKVEEVTEDLLVHQDFKVLLEHQDQLETKVSEVPLEKMEHQVYQEKTVKMEFIFLVILETWYVY